MSSPGPTVSGHGIASAMSMATVARHRGAQVVRAAAAARAYALDGTRLRSHLAVSPRAGEIGVYDVNGDSRGRRDRSAHNCVSVVRAEARGDSTPTFERT